MGAPESAAPGLHDQPLPTQLALPPPPSPPALWLQPVDTEGFLLVCSLLSCMESLDLTPSSPEVGSVALLPQNHTRGALPQLGRMLKEEQAKCAKGAPIPLTERKLMSLWDLRRRQ